MCGISGFVGQGDAQDLARMSNALKHRGPDGCGEWHDPERAVHLAVQRLAVVDRAHAAQPMRASDNALVVAFNGEIYNHQDLRRQLEATGAAFFSDHSDTEVLLNAYRVWGVRLVEHLEGMWAFAIYDARQHTLLLSRDRFGQKPLVYSVQNGTFAFASEVTALLQHRGITASIASLSVQKYFAYGFIPAPHSLYHNIFKLPAGCSLSVDTRTLSCRVSRYWDFTLEPGERAVDAAAERRLADELRHLLQQAVRRQGRADVPVGVFLSGGIDSSTITYFAQQETLRPVETFAVGFDHRGYDESAQASRVSALLGTHHTLATLADCDAGVVLGRIAGRLDEPIGDSSLVCTYVLCESARRHVTVALGGEGADELFGGYDPFRVLHAAELYSRWMPAPVHRAIRLVAARLPSRSGYMSFDYRLTRLLRGLSYPPPLWNPSWIGPLEPSELADCFADSASLESVYADAIALWDSCSHLGVVERSMQFFVKLYFQDDILTKVDRAGMMNSLEVRSPFLDLDLVDFVRRLPTDLKVRRGRTKHLLKEAMRPLLPSWIVDRPKHGFAVPMAEWLRSGCLALGAVEPGRDMHVEFVNRKVTAHQTGRENNAVFLWSLWLLTRTADARATV